MLLFAGKGDRVSPIMDVGLHLAPPSAEFSTVSTGLLRRKSLSLNRLERQTEREMVWKSGTSDGSDRDHRPDGLSQGGGA